MSALAFDAIAAAVRERFAAVEAKRADNGWPYLLVPGSAIVDVARLLRTSPQLACDGLMDLSGCDWMKYPAAPPAVPSTAIVVAYQLFSYRHRHKVTLHVEVPRDACAVPTVSGEWPAALYFEREVFDLLGVTFTDHPDLTRILMPEDWEGHPLRKDYLYPAAYHGVAHLRDGQHFEAAPARGAAPGGSAASSGAASKGHP